ncbi:MAG: bacteriocin [Eubacteriales bacterium]|nr:bacteriocin [Eubacteriales bacterium]
MKNAKLLTEDELRQVNGGGALSSQRGRAYEKLIKAILGFFGLK